MLVAENTSNVLIIDDTHHGMPGSLNSISDLLSMTALTKLALVRPGLGESR